MMAKKKFFSYVILLAFFWGVLYSKDKLTEMIADFEDGRLITNAGTLWSTYSDGNAGGNSEAVVRILEKGAAGSKKCLRIEGTLGKQFQWPFAGTQVFFSSDRIPHDLRGKTGISFYVRGDGGKYLFQVLTASVFDHNHFSKLFTADDKWRKLEIPFTDLKQNPNWGQQVSWTAKDVRGLGFHVFGDTRTFYFEIDQIETY